MAAGSSRPSRPNSARSARSVSFDEQGSEPGCASGAPYRDLPGACAAYAELCGWRPEQLDTPSGSYVALGLGSEIGGGVVECNTPRPMWLPYVQVSEIGAATTRARELGATVLLKSREGPAGWRTVVSVPAGGEVAFWQPKGWES